MREGGQGLADLTLSDKRWPGKLANQREPCRVSKSDYCNQQSLRGGFVKEVTYQKKTRLRDNLSQEAFASA